MTEFRIMGEKINAVVVSMSMNSMKIIIKLCNYQRSNFTAEKTTGTLHMEFRRIADGSKMVINQIGTVNSVDSFSQLGMGMYIMKLVFKTKPVDAYIGIVSSIMEKIEKINESGQIGHAKLNATLYTHGFSHPCTIKDAREQWIE